MSLASELRKTAEQAIVSRENLKVNSLFEYLLKRADQAVKQGKTNYKLILDDTEWSSKNAKEAQPLLEQEGFKVIVDSEITHQYSNTDWDDQYYIEISW